MRAVFDHLGEVLQDKCRLFLIGQPEGTQALWALSRIGNSRKLHDATFADCLPELYRIAVADLNPRLRGDCMLQAMSSFSKCLVRSCRSRCGR